MTSKYNPSRDKVISFDSPEAFLAYAKDVPEHSRCTESTRFAGDDYTTALDKLEHGDLTNVAAAEKIIDQMQDEHVFVSGVKIMQPSVVGFLPNVPAALMGHPKSMLNREISELESPQTPLCVYIDATVSGGVRQDEIMRRGIATLAFVMAMQVYRPIELYVISCMNAKQDNKSAQGVAIRIETKPVDLARAAFLLTTNTFARRLGFSACFNLIDKPYNTSRLPWPWDTSPSHGYAEPMRELFNMNPQDVFLQGGYLFDNLMLNNPVQWVKNMVQEHSGREPE